MEVWLSEGLGRHLSGHFCPFLQGTCHPRTREGRRSSGRQEVREVHGPPTRPLLLACSHRDLRGQLARSRWPYLKNWGAAPEQRQVSRSPESICSNGSLWQFSGGTVVSVWLRETRGTVPQCCLARVWPRETNLSAGEH